MSTSTRVERWRRTAVGGGMHFGRPARVVRTPRQRLSGVIDLRTAIVTTVLFCTAAVLALIALGVGDYPVPVLRVLAVLLGDGAPRDSLVVLEWRMPRVLLALVLGGALGVSGAIFQALTRNPLGSPDVIGFNTGAYTGALLVILVIGASGFGATASGAFVGGVVTAAGIYLLAFRRGVQGFRLIIVGIGVSAVLSSVNTWLVLRGDLQDAMSASMWGAGTLNGATWAQALPALIAAALLLPAVIGSVRPLRMLELGDDAATALGVGTERSRLALILLGVALTALATSTAGPIAFVALAAPQLARRLTRAAGASPLSAMAMGSVLLVGSDLVAQRAFAPIQLPVGVVTASVGGVYLVWLLVREARRS
ncbi:iron chelate uptake ABC transporter family permease subunit [Saccharomonospora sp. NPDC046836]|uniref:FecCD family ABC transporter permease n=1 Tax=Saccharomonospora sp. NPDC046836 TaxID=3156921 RepID=UPI0033DEEF5F